MNAADFNEIFREVFSKSSSVLVQKGAEYADDTDVLRAFKKAAALLDESPRESLAGMLAKHTISVYDMIAAVDTPPIEKWDEKIIDHINYLILLRALVVEELEGKL